jgi:alpha-glucosidase
MTGERWWRRGVLYNAYPRSWHDSNGDGIGDLRGIVERLDHLQWLGVDGLWLNPITRSPNRDWGYDVSDYCAVHPDLGSLEDLDLLLTEAHGRGIRVLLDLVPSHTSDEHPWFEEARRSRRSRFHHYYVWRRAAADGKPPTNWLSYFGEPAWSFDELCGEYYLHNFTRHQPQLNWWNPDVRAEFNRILRFWFDRGVDGMRIDALQALYYDRAFRENPPADAHDSDKERQLGQRFAFNANRPEVHQAIRHWRVLADSYDAQRVLFGETWVPTVRRMAAFYGNGGDELHLAWNVPFLGSSFRAPALGSVIAETLQLMPAGATPAWAMSTHDSAGRAASRWCGGDDAAIRGALFLLLSLDGTPILYYGDEIGMLEPPRELLTGRARDTADGRDASRTPMQWEDSRGSGFTTAPSSWLPLGDTSKANVCQQLRDRASVLHLCRDLIRIRHELPSQPMSLLPGTANVLAWRYGNATVAVNLGDERAELRAAGTLALCTNRDRERERVRGTLSLAPHEGAIVLARRSRPRA